MTQAAERVKRYNVWGMETAEHEQGDFVKYGDHVQALADAERRGRAQVEAEYSSVYQDHLTQIQVLKTVIEKIILAWGNRGEETSLHVWNERVQEAISFAMPYIETSRTVEAQQEATHG